MKFNVSVHIVGRVQGVRISLAEDGSCVDAVTFGEPCLETYPFVLA